MPHFWRISSKDYVSLAERRVCLTPARTGLWPLLEAAGVRVPEVARHSGRGSMNLSDGLRLQRYGRDFSMKAKRQM